MRRSAQEGEPVILWVLLFFSGIFVSAFGVGITLADGDFTLESTAGLAACLGVLLMVVGAGRIIWLYLSALRSLRSFEKSLSGVLARTRKRDSLRALERRMAAISKQWEMMLPGSNVLMFSQLRAAWRKDISVGRLVFGNDLRLSHMALGSFAIVELSGESYLPTVAFFHPVGVSVKSGEIESRDVPRGIEYYQQFPGPVRQALDCLVPCEIGVFPDSMVFSNLDVGRSTSREDLVGVIDAISAFAESITMAEFERGAVSYSAGV